MASIEDAVSIVEPTHNITLFIAGDAHTARELVRRFCYNVGSCFTVTPTEFIYTGGSESGVSIGLVNYPRFPCKLDDLHSIAIKLAECLMPGLNQRSCLLVGPAETEWLTLQPPGDRSQRRARADE